MLRLKGCFLGTEFNAAGAADGVGSSATFTVKGRRIKSIDLT